MLTKPDARALKGLYSWSQHTAWDDIKKMFEAELAKTQELLMSHLDEVKLRQMQGRAQLISEFLAIVADARGHLEKLRESTL